MNKYAGKARVGAASERLARALARALGWSLSASRAMVRPGLLVAMLIVLAPVFLVLTQSGLHAVAAYSITVNTTDDPGLVTQCDLRDAIIAANTDTTVNGCVVTVPGNPTINFSVSGTITLSSALPQVADISPYSLTIDGTGQSIAIDGSVGPYQILYVSSGATLTLNDLTIQNGSSGSGGGVDNEGTLTVTNSTFATNNASAGLGGGIYNNGTLSVSNSTFYGNGASNSGYGGGGGIFNNTAATMTVTNSSFSGNNADNGGAIRNIGSATVSNSTFSSTSASYGGGIHDEYSATLTVTNSTFYDNTAANNGGGIFNGYGPTLTVTNSTFFNNSASSGGGVWNNASATVSNSILADSTSGGNCSGVGDGGYNISDDGSCGFSGTSVNSTNPLLATAGLANNGGPTQTIALQAASPAVDVIPPASCTLTTDQRGDPRPAPGFTNCDIGAYELQPIIVNTLVDDSTSGDTLCSLRKAINNANSPDVDTTGGDCGLGTGNDDIIFSVTGPI